MLLLAVGCAETPPPDSSDTKPSPASAARFDLSRTGTIEGQLSWAGAVPNVPLMHSSPTPLKPPPQEVIRTWKNPFIPQVDSTGGVEDAVVFLSGVEPERARPWDHPPARVELRDYRIQVSQGAARSRSGFVRQGTKVEIRSGDAMQYVLRGRGAAYFTHQFVEPNRPRRRLFADRGIVQLGEGTGRFWMRGFLFVGDHPYFTRTDPHGHFCLEQVPEGEYDLSFFLPNWQIRKIERDSSWTQASDVTYGRPLVLVRKVRVHAGQTTWANAEVTESAFGE